MKRYDYKLEKYLKRYFKGSYYYYYNHLYDYFSVVTATNEYDIHTFCIPNKWNIITIKNIKNILEELYNG